jgi:hypothetical protein
MGEAVNRPPLTRNQLAQAVFISIRVFVKLLPEFRCLVVAEDAKRV